MTDRKDGSTPGSAAAAAPVVADRTAFPADLSNCILLVDKPAGWTSFDVIRKLRRITGIRKIGHAGTLDPMATGLLICMLGSATKMMSRLVDLDKTYTGVLRLGETTASHDAETPIDVRRDASHIVLAGLAFAAAQLTGEIVQTTPTYSAVRVGGERLYKKARRGERVKGPPRQVSVYEFHFTDLVDQCGRFEVRCSKGTYVRRLAHDVGEILGVGAHLIELRRETIGEYKVSDAVSLEELQVRMTSADRNTASGA